MLNHGLDARLDGILDRINIILVGRLPDEVSEVANVNGFETLLISIASSSWFAEFFNNAVGSENAERVRDKGTGHVEVCCVACCFVHPR